MPVATKKMAAKTSRSGRISRSTRRPAPDSATSSPPRKAPSATENPARPASDDMRNAKPTMLTSMVSGLRRPMMARAARGTRASPATRKRTSSPTRRPTTAARAPPLSPSPEAAAVSSAMMSIAPRSSNSVSWKTVSRSSGSTGCSSSTLAMTMVLDAATAPPKKRLPIGLQPDRPATAKPSASMRPISTTAATAPVAPARPGGPGGSRARWRT